MKNFKKSLKTENNYSIQKPCGGGVDGINRPDENASDLEMEVFMKFFKKLLAKKLVWEINRMKGVDSHIDKNGNYHLVITDKDEVLSNRRFIPKFRKLSELNDEIKEL